MEDITDVDYTDAKRVCKDFKMKKLSVYQDLHGQSNTLLLADVFENFQNMCLEICELDPARFPNAPGLAWQAALKKAKVKLHPLNDTDLLLMVGGRICHAFH